MYLRNDAPVPEAVVRVERAKELFKVLEDGMRDVEHAVRRMAAAWRELKNMGADLSPYKGGLWDYIERVASGTLAPEVLSRLAGNKTALAAMATLKVSEQKLVMKSGNLEVFSDRGAVETKPISHLSSREIKRAIDSKVGRLIPACDQKKSAAKMRSPRRGERFAVSLTAIETEKLLQKSRALKQPPAKLIKDAMRQARLI